MEVFSEDNYLEIERLAKNAIYAPTKAAAAFPIKRLEFLQQISDYDRNTSEILGQVVAYAKSAAGQVKGKENYVEDVKTELYKLHGKVKKTEE